MSVWSSLFSDARFNRRQGSVETFFLHIFSPGRALHHQGAMKNGTEHLMSGNTFNFTVTCIVGNVQLYCFPNFSFMLAYSQTRFRKSRFIWKCTFFVVLVFAKFSIKSVQQAKKPASPLGFPLLFFLLRFCCLEYFCTYVASLYVYTYKYLRIFSMERLDRNSL